MRKLLFSITKKDLEISYFSGTGGGGQHRNRHMNCVRLRHRDSGVSVTGQSEKSQGKNIREALNNLVKHPKFKMWHRNKVQETIEQRTLEELVDEMMKPENLKVEIRDSGGKWIDEDLV